jgi:cyclic pyranopterin phosphate synthase
MPLEPEASRQSGDRRIPLRIAASAPALAITPAGSRLLPLPPPRMATSAPSPGPTPAPHRQRPEALGPHALPHDALKRPLRDLRISVTDRCNFRCAYCMPREVFGKDHPFLPQPELLHFEEITRVARVMAGLGVHKLRLTGGEPLLRKDLERLVAQLSALRTPQGQPLGLAMTTNGTLLARKAASLKAAGLQRVTVSLDALDPARFRQLSDADVHVADVLAGIEAAQAAGLGPVKVNMVVQRGVNDDQILPMARHFRGTGVILRFIEFMDVGQTNQWRMDQVLPSAEVLRQLQAVYPLRALSPSAPGETANRWAYADGQGEVGFISSVTQAFCGDCSRLRMSTDGRLFTCLFASQGHDVRAALRAPQAWSDEALSDSLSQLWAARSDRYSQLRVSGNDLAATHPDTALAAPRRIEMSYIGG